MQHTSLHPANTLSMTEQWNEWIIGENNLPAILRFLWWHCECECRADIRRKCSILTIAPVNRNQLKESGSNGSQQKQLIPVETLEKAPELMVEGDGRDVALYFSLQLVKVMGLDNANILIYLNWESTSNGQSTQDCSKQANNSHQPSSPRCSAKISKCHKNYFHLYCFH